MNLHLKLLFILHTIFIRKLLMYNYNICSMNYEHNVCNYFLITSVKVSYVSFLWFVQIICVNIPLESFSGMMGVLKHDVIQATR